MQNDDAKDNRSIQARSTTDSSCSFSLTILVVRLTGRVSETNGGALTSVGFRRGILELFIGGMAVSWQGLCCVMLSIRIVINNNMLVTVNITTIININNNVNNNVNSAIPDQIS